MGIVAPKAKYLIRRPIVIFCKILGLVIVETLVHIGEGGWGDSATTDTKGRMQCILEVN